jgi:hypothetical protein
MLTTTQPSQQQHQHNHRRQPSAEQSSHGRSQRRRPTMKKSIRLHVGHLGVNGTCHQTKADDRASNGSNHTSKLLVTLYHNAFLPRDDPPSRILCRPPMKHQEKRRLT